MNNSNEYTLDQLFDACRQQHDQFCRVAHERPLSASRLNPRATRRAVHRRPWVRLALLVLLCLGGLGCLALSYRSHVLDLFDLVPHLFLAVLLLGLLLVALAPLVRAHTLWCSYSSLRAAVCICLFSVLLVTFTLPYAGRSSSMHKWNQQVVCMAQIGQIVCNYSNTNLA